MHSASSAKAGELLLICEEPTDHMRIVDRVVTLHEHASLSVDDSGGQTTDVRRDHGSATRLRFDGHESEGFVV